MFVFFIFPRGILWFYFTSKENYSGQRKNMTLLETILIKATFRFLGLVILPQINL